MEASAGKAKGPPVEEAPAGKGWGVGPGPNAGGKGCRKGGRKDKKKVSEMNEDEKELEKKRLLAAMIARRTDDFVTAFPKWIKGFRTPVGQRWGHLRPKQCAHRAGNFSNILGKALVNDDLSKKLFDYVHQIYQRHEPAIREVVGQWLGERHFGDARKICELETESGKHTMLSSVLWEGGPAFSQFVRNSGCNFPPVSDDSTGKEITTDFYFTDFDPDKWETFKAIVDKRKCWLQWHGTNFYSLSTILAANYVGLSKSEKKGHELAMQRGIYSTHFFQTAAHYSTPHVFEKCLGGGEVTQTLINGGATENTLPLVYLSPVLVRATLLILVPGDATDGGVGIFHKLPDNGWVYDGDSKEKVKLPLWQLTKLPSTLHIPTAIESGFEFTLEGTSDPIDPRLPGQWKSEPDMNQRLDKPGEELRYLQFTNVSNSLDQCASSQGHVVGFAISYHNHVAHNTFYSKKGVKRKKHIFCGWDSKVELNYGKPTPWDKKYPFSDQHPYYGMSSTDQTRHVSEAASSSDWPRPEWPGEGPAEQGPNCYVLGPRTH